MTAQELNFTLACYEWVADKKKEEQEKAKKGTGKKPRP